SGYLTRRLIDVAQDVIVTEEDCGTPDGILITREDSIAMGLDATQWGSRLVGRILAEQVPGFEHVEVGEELTEDVVEEIVSAGIPAVRVRSVLNCMARRGICR